MTKKNRIIKILIINILFLFLVSCKDANYNNEIIVINAIKEKLINEDYVYAEYSSGKIYLKNIDFQITKEIIMPEDIKNIYSGIHNFYKDKDIVFFILSGAVDDDNGILYSPNHIIDMQGIYSIERLNGSLFLYSTTR